jgi:hypothetical protein
MNIYPKILQFYDIIKYYDFLSEANAVDSAMDVHKNLYPYQEIPPVMN